MTGKMSETTIVVCTVTGAIFGFCLGVLAFAPKENDRRLEDAVRAQIEKREGSSDE
jgi:hypothetical protein